MRFMVLNDGETYTTSEGCFLLDVKPVDEENVAWSGPGETDDWDEIVKDAIKVLDDPSTVDVTFSTEHGEVFVQKIARFD